MRQRCQGLCRLLAGPTSAGVKQAAVKIYFDGGCRPNPGRIETAVVVGGRSIVRDDHGQGDSHDAEWLALLDALTVARDLAPLGYEITVFEGEAKAGGFIRSQIPRFRLPEEVIDEETGYILDMGVKFVNNQRVDSMQALLAQNFDAVFVGCGAPRGRELDVPGRAEAAAHIHIGIDWLANVSFGHTTSVAERVIVLGGGNTAMDCCQGAEHDCDDCGDHCGQSHDSQGYAKARKQNLVDGFGHRPRCTKVKANSTRKPG